MSKFQAKLDADSLIYSLGHCESDGRTVHKLRQRRPTNDWLAPRESDCSRMRRKVSSDWLPSYIRVTQPVLEILNMAGYFPDRPRNNKWTWINIYQKILIFKIRCSKNSGILHNSKIHVITMWYAEMCMRVVQHSAKLLQWHNIYDLQGWKTHLYLRMGQNWRSQLLIAEWTNTINRLFSYCKIDRLNFLLQNGPKLWSPRILHWGQERSWLLGYGTNNLSSILKIMLYKSCLQLYLYTYKY